MALAGDDFPVDPGEQQAGPDGADFRAQVSPLDHRDREEGHPREEQETRGKK